MQECAMACNGYTKGVLFLATEVAKCIGTAAKYSTLLQPRAEKSWIKQGVAERRLVSEKKILKQRRGSDKSCLRVEATQTRSSEIAQKEGWLRAELRQELESKIRDGSEQRCLKEEVPFREWLARRILGEIYDLFWKGHPCPASKYLRNFRQGQKLKQPFISHDVLFGRRVETKPSERGCGIFKA